MDLKVEIKEEPVWLEDTTNTSLDLHIDNAVHSDGIINVESQTSVIPKVENVPLDPRSKDDVTKPAADVKDDIVKEECTVDQLVPYIKEEDNVEDVGTLTTGSVQTCEGSGQALLRQCNLLTQGDETPHYSSGCGSKFSQQHYDKSLSSTDSMEKSYICNICKRTFSQKFRFNDHLLSHSRPHQCNVCSKTFPRKNLLERHMLGHTTEGSFSCNICNKKFKAKDTLKIHMTIHSGERPFVCTVCSRNFRTKKSLNEHVAIHSAERQFVCNCCKKAFARKSGLRQHVAVHSEDRVFGCKLCIKKFYTEDSLKKHISIHTRDGYFSCSYCSRNFRGKRDLIEHIAAHIGVRPYTCDICNKSFTTKSYLKRHTLGCSFSGIALLLLFTVGGFASSLHFQNTCSLTLPKKGHSTEPLSKAIPLTIVCSPLNSNHHTLVKRLLYI